MIMLIEHGVVMSKKKRYFEEKNEEVVEEIQEEFISFDKGLKLYKLKNPERSHYMKDKEVILKFIQKHIQPNVIMSEVQWFSLLDLF